jgi:hypothetical protein
MLAVVRTDIFFARTTKPICNFANSVVLMFNININYYVFIFDVSQIVHQDIRGQHVISAASEESNHIKIVLLQSYRNDLCLLLLFTFICFLHFFFCPDFVNKLIFILFLYLYNKHRLFVSQLYTKETDKEQLTHD